MGSNTRRHDQRAYKECGEATHNEVRSELERIIETGILTQGDDSRLKTSLQDRIDIFNAAVVVFKFFLPLQFEGLGVKFWGALKQLLDVSWPFWGAE